MGTFDLREQVAKHSLKVQAPKHYCERQIKLKIWDYCEPCSEKD